METIQVYIDSNILTNKIAIGRGIDINQHSETLVINASDNPLKTTNSNSTYISPLRVAPGTHVVHYNINTKELTIQPIE
jgi:hypothetical protein